MSLGVKILIYEATGFCWGPPWGWLRSSELDACFSTKRLEKTRVLIFRCEPLTTEFQNHWAFLGDTWKNHWKNSGQKSRANARPMARYFSGIRKHVKTRDLSHRVFSGRRLVTRTKPWNSIVLMSFLNNFHRKKNKPYFFLAVFEKTRQTRFSSFFAIEI